MIFPALMEAADRGELLLIQDGLCRYHLRRDGIVVIRELIVLPFIRRTGQGKHLVDMVRDKHRGRTIIAKCPVSYESNGFWKAMGFKLVATSNGVNEWRWGCQD